MFVIFKFTIIIHILIIESLCPLQFTFIMIIIKNFIQEIGINKYYIYMS